MEDVVGTFALARVLHREHRAIVRSQDPGIAGLAAAFGVEDRAVEPHRTGLYRADARLAGTGVGLGAEQQLSRRHRVRRRARAAPAGRARAGTPR